MTTQIKISLGSISVDLTSCGVSISHRLSNPVIVIDTPRLDLNISNSVGINIGFVTEAFDLGFTLTDGLGTLDWATPVTNYEKLFHMAYKVNPKTLMINDRAITGHIENISLPWEAGKKDMSIDGTLTFRVCMNIEMEPAAAEEVSVTFNNGSCYLAITGADAYFKVGDRVYLSTDDTLPTPFSNLTRYWVVAVQPGYIWVATTKTGQPVTATSAGSGDHTVAHG